MKFPISSCLLLCVLTLHSAALGKGTVENQVQDTRKNNKLPSASRKLDNFADLFDDGYWKQLGGKVYGSNHFDASGTAVAISKNGDIIAIGSPFHPQNGTKSGCAKVFMYANKQWTQRGETIYGEGSEDEFGSSLDLNSDGKILAVGAPMNDGVGPHGGSVKVYEYDEVEVGGKLLSAWRQMGEEINGESQRDYSGAAISLSDDGKTLAIAANQNTGEKGALSGHVRVFHFSNSGWSQMGNDIDGPGPTALFGTSVSLAGSGNVVAIGAPKYGQTGQTRVYRYVELTKTWDQLGNGISGELPYELSGASISISQYGLTIAIGAPEYGVDTRKGAARIYQWSDAALQWFQLGKSIYGENDDDRFGTSLALSANGRIVAVGAPMNGKNNGTMYAAGHTLIYTYMPWSSSWVLVDKSIDGNAGDLFGTSVALSYDGRTAIIGAPGEDYSTSRVDSGSAGVYQWVEGASSTPKPTPAPTNNKGKTLNSIIVPGTMVMIVLSLQFMV